MWRAPLRSTVLVVDDYNIWRQSFISVFGKQRVTAASSASEVSDLVASGRSWTYAFVDFQFRPNEPTGLSVMQTLAQTETKAITYTAAREAGRPLFIAAAHRWWGAVSHLEKESVTVDALGGFVASLDEGLNPIDPSLFRLQRYSHYVDQLFRMDHWVRIWPELLETSASRELIHRRTGLGTSQVDTFLKDHAGRASAQGHLHELYKYLLDQELEDDIIGKGALTMKLAAEHLNFFTAVDLPRVLAALRAEGKLPTVTARGGRQGRRK